MKTSPLPVLGIVAALLAAPTVRAQGYPSLSEIVGEMQTAAANFPSICQFVDVTATYGAPPTHQGRSIHAVRISDNVAQEEDEPSFFMAATHHGNEIVNPVIALDTIARLTQGYGVDPVITSLVDDNEIWIIPNCNPDGYVNGSRHNANPAGSVDLNRNYPFLWDSPCNTGVKGVAPASEPETQTIIALSLDQHFTKVLDFHSSGRETLYAYRQSCPNHVLTSYLQSEAVAISQASSYQGDVRGPSSNGEHYHWQLGVLGNYAFLTETHASQQPSYNSAVAEAAAVWPGTVFMLQRPIPVWGHVTDSATGEPVVADISYLENPFTEGEQNRSAGTLGRYHVFLPTGNHTLRFQHPCYFTQDVPVTVTPAGLMLDLQLVRDNCFGLGFSTTGVGDLHIAVVDIPASTVTGFTVFSFDTSLPAGAGTVFGINPDLLTLQGLLSVQAPGNPFHWGPPYVPGMFPDVPLDLPPGTMAPFAGVSVDGRAVAFDAGWTATLSELIRLTL